MGRERIGKIGFVENKCYLKVGFVDKDGKWDEKMLPAQNVLDFYNRMCDITEECVKIEEHNKRLGNIHRIMKCELDFPIKKSRNLTDY